MKDRFNTLHPLPAIAPAAAITDNTALVGAWIDRTGYNALTYLLITGTDADSDATFEVTDPQGRTRSSRPPGALEPFP